MHFSKIVLQYMASVLDDMEPGICRDQYVGEIPKILAKKRFFRVDINDRPKNIPYLILILESPHTDEFDPASFDPQIPVPSPALGKTGLRIIEHLEEVIKLRAKEGYDEKYIDFILQNCGLILFNAIQNQCSLGQTPNRFRDEIFLRAWNDYGSDEFKKRLRKIVDEHDEVVVIANWCTQAKSYDRRRIVQEAIEDELGINDEHLMLNHPSSWWRFANRKNSWKIEYIKSKGRN